MLHKFIVPDEEKENYGPITHFLKIMKLRMFFCYSEERILKQLTKISIRLLLLIQL